MPDSSDQSYKSYVLADSYPVLKINQTTGK